MAHLPIPQRGVQNSFSGYSAWDTWRRKFRLRVLLFSAISANALTLFSRSLSYYRYCIILAVVNVVK